MFLLTFCEVGEYQYAGAKMGFYQKIDADGKTIIKVQTGRVGYIREFKSSDDALLKRIEEFCKRHRYIRVCENARDDLFFK